METPTTPEHAENPTGKKSAHSPLFRFLEVPTADGPTAIRMDTQSKLEGKKHDLQGVMVRLPLKLRQRIEEQTRGALSVTLCALAEYALERLEAENKGIRATVDPGPQNK